MEQQQQQLIISSSADNDGSQQKKSEGEKPEEKKPELHDLPILCRGCQSVLALKTKSCGCSNDGVGGDSRCRFAKMACGHECSSCSTRTYAPVFAPTPGAEFNGLCPPCRDGRWAGCYWPLYPGDGIVMLGKAARST